MSKTAQQLIIDAYYQTGIIPQENGNVPPYLIDQGLTLLNDIITMWGADTSLAPYQNVLEFNFVANQERYTFGLGTDYDVNTEPFIEISSFTYNIATNAINNLHFSCSEMNEVQYSNILYRNIQTYPAQYLIRMFPEYTELLVQPLPMGDYPVQLVLKNRLASFQLYQDLECKFPPGFILCLKYQLMLDLFDSRGMDISPAFLAKANKALANMQGNNKMDMYSRKTEMLGNRRKGWGYWLTGQSQ